MVPVLFQGLFDSMQLDSDFLIGYLELKVVENRLKLGFLWLGGRQWLIFIDFSFWYCLGVGH